MRAGLAATVSMLLIACSSQATRPWAPPARASAQPSVVSSGCGATAVLVGGIPQWLDSAGSNNNPSTLPYVIAHPPMAAGFLFAYPLRSGHRENPTNKILWLVRTPRNGSNLTIDGHPLGGTTPIVHIVRPADSSPGEIYPSVVDVPSPGCWEFDLHWGRSHAQIELNYLSAA